MLWLRAFGASMFVALMLILESDDKLQFCCGRTVGGDADSRRWRLKAGEGAAEGGGGGGSGGDRLPPPIGCSRILFVVL
jgi:hypothetical protein